MSQFLVIKTPFTSQSKDTGVHPAVLQSQITVIPHYTARESDSIRTMTEIKTVPPTEI